MNLVSIGASLLLIYLSIFVWNYVQLYVNKWNYVLFIYIYFYIFFLVPPGLNGIIPNEKLEGMYKIHFH